jgi:hypothetical protein
MKNDSLENSLISGKHEKFALRLLSVVIGGMF